MENSKILPCTCESKFQDELYGPKRRVHARTKQSDGNCKIYRCCICGKEKTT